MEKKRGRGQKAFTNKVDLKTASAEMIRMVRLGLPYWHIAEKYNITIARVAQIKKAHMEEMGLLEEADVLAIKNEQRMRCEEIRLMCMEGWERSLSPKSRSVKEWMPLREEEEEKRSPKKKSPTAKLKSAPFREVMKLMKAVRQVEGRLPASEFLRIIVDTMNFEAKLFGLFIEIKLEQNTYNIVDFDEMRTPAQVTDPMKVHEAKLISSKRSKKQDFESEMNGAMKKEEEE